MKTIFYLKNSPQKKVYKMHMHFIHLWDLIDFLGGIFVKMQQTQHTMMHDNVK